MTSRLWFQAGVGILLAMLIIFLFQQIEEVFNPVVIIAKTIFLPLLLGGVLFYLTRPILQFLESKRFPRWASITTILVLIALILWLIYAMIGPIVNQQASSLVENTPQMIDQGEQWVDYLLNQRENLPPQVQDRIETAISNVTNNINEWTVGFGSWLLTFLQNFVQALFLVVLAPFFLVYMLKDHERFVPFVSGFFHGERRSWVRKTLHDLDVTLRSYIQGQLLVSFLVGIMLLIGYLIIGLDYALLLSLFGMMTNVIPFLGPYLAVIPALVVALLQEPQMALYVAIIMLVAQQVESTFISPNVMGKALDVHPLTVITVILAAGNIAGLWGVILAIPVYGVIKTIVSNLYHKRRSIRKAAGKDVD